MPETTRLRIINRNSGIFGGNPQISIGRFGHGTQRFSLQISRFIVGINGFEANMTRFGHIYTTKISSYKKHILAVPENFINSIVVDGFTIFVERLHIMLKKTGFYIHNVQTLFCPNPIFILILRFLQRSYIIHFHTIGRHKRLKNATFEVESVKPFFECTYP